MEIKAIVANRPGEHVVKVATDGNEQVLSIPAKTTQPGSAVNGGELLFAALATCYCNDLYREASKRGIAISGVSVEVSGEFGGAGEPARNVRYHASVEASATPEEIRDLLRATDEVAEIQKTVRQGATIVFTS